MMDASYFTGEPLEVGTDVNLLIDETMVEDRWDVERIVNVPIKHPHNPVVLPDRLWEKSGGIGCPNVLYDEERKLFRMWYAVYDMEAWGRQFLHGQWKREGNQTASYMVAYAESADGITWEKPLLDKLLYDGAERTNIIFTGTSMAANPQASRTPAHMRHLGRFMLIFRDYVPGRPRHEAMLYFTDDGIDYRPYEGNPVHRVQDTSNNMHYDERRGLWLLYGRPYANAADKLVYTKGGVNLRVAVATSKDLKSWSPVREVVCPDEADGNFFFDHMPVQIYGNHLLGFLAVTSRGTDGSGHVELASSADGFRWHRSAKRQPFLTAGREGDWDAGFVWEVARAVPSGNFLYFYYSGSNRPNRYRFPENISCIGMAHIQRDRFVSLLGDVEGGWVLSREVKVAGDRLLVNCAPRHRAFGRQGHGWLKVQLIDGSGDAIESFTMDDCDPIRVDSLAYPVSWKGTSDISKLRGKGVHVRFFLSNAHVFAFRFAEGSSQQKQH
jgi:hypothetical protein